MNVQNFVIKHGPEHIKQKLREGKSSINKEYEKIRRDLRRQQFLEDHKDLVAVDDNNEHYRLILGDFREVAKEISDNSIDLIFTDPPYEGSLLIYKDLAILAKRVLRPGGLLVTYVGGYNLPLNLDYLKIDGLNYHWRFCVKHSGYHMKLHHYNVFIEWKLLLSYVKGEKPNEFAMKNTVSDFIQSEKPDKILHPWEQSIIEAKYMIEKLTLEKYSTVLDPFLGSGTTGVAALKLNRKFIGIEIDKDRFEIAKARISSIEKNKEGVQI